MAIPRVVARRWIPLPGPSGAQGLCAAVEVVHDDHPEKGRGGDVHVPRVLEPVAVVFRGGWAGEEFREGSAQRREAGGVKELHPVRVHPENPRLRVVGVR